MAGIPEVVAKGGLPPELSDPDAAGFESPRKKGVKQGALMMLSSLILVPVVAVVSAALDITPVFVALTAIVTFWGGFLRILFALIFQSGKPARNESGFVESFKRTIKGGRQAPQSLPPSDEIPADAVFTAAPGSWRDTNDLSPASVTEETTRALNHPGLNQN
ncbi:MAG: hypothetical protein DWQ47_04345 [Acidobacteria bacterium]|nr:MAG: hypothetical protein DWQ32_07895 [Acidobacteriota bacterium]REK01622.1 MAG: hypothetical protein DWQ38_04330 [Acidobacteriota bacterium]REK14578.1 MAG: hypothetical protein DWQ43_13585 [Acidobacteriota bacterium]REK45293.1 MAG: hypothetical protein DWQ47_04345 [Acidobacteriota bacterium]